ncbi:MAG: S8 family serine peptidase [Ignavibacteriaceae bacterium]|nr:S8 family serine peptidase [Ignavibacteriaceae bacterium]
MKYKFLFSLSLLITFATSIFSQNVFFIKYNDTVPKEEIELKVAQDQFIPSGIQFQVNAELESVNYLAKGIAKNDERLGRIVKLTFKDDVDESAIIRLQNLDPAIEYIQKATTYKSDFAPNDSLISEQWALEKVKAFDAWDKTQGADTVLLGFIDTGIDYDHPDLKNKIWQNPGETGNGKESNGIDDDNNGFIDDYRGWDFTDRVGFPFDTSGGDYLDWDNDPKDEQGHGTFISGIAGAQTNNLTGIAGAAPNIQLVNLRAFDPAGYGEEDDVAAAILYAVQMNVKVINMSFGDNAFSLVLKDVIQFAYSKNVVLVGSSGNSGSPDPHYPSGYSEVICVGNSTIDDFVASNSNYGSTLDLVAPGTQVLTTARKNNYSTINGTSASTPHVAATAALILSLQNFTNEEVKQILKSTTDDIGEPGWDIKSGAGRLNMFKAVTVVAPSVIKFNHPRQDFATLDDTLIINATVLSGLFSNFNLVYGTGLNPDDWTPLIENGLNQFSNDDIYKLNLAALPDTVYCLRLVVQLTNGRTLEERVNFFINRTPPIADLISVGPAFYGDKTTVLAAMVTDEPSITRMYYRKIGETDFNFVTLDGFTTNNQFVKYLHYGFIPKQLVDQNSAYEVYFEAENLVGLKTLDDNGGQYYSFITNYDAEYAAETMLSYSLPPGSLFEDPVNITSNDFNEIYLRELTNARVSSLYRMSNNSFEFVDTLSDRIVRDFGDFNNNGLKDLLTFFVRDGFIYEQQNQNSSSFTQKYSDESGTFWPVMAEDIDGDNITEVVVVSSDTSATIWEANNDLTLSNPENLYNYTPSTFGFNILDSPQGVVADIDDDGTNEIWFVDVDGDIFSHDILGPNNYQPGTVFSTAFFGSSAFIDAGDYNGDGKEELAVLLRSVSFFDVAPYYLLLVFNITSAGDLNILYEQILIDAATEFTSSFQRSENSIRFTDIDLDGQDELIVFVFPYSYIFKDFFGSDKVVSYKENINSNSIFVGDLNFNTVPEIAFPTDQGINFYEFTVSNKASTPYNLEGFSADATTILLEWQGSTDQYYVYRGTTAENLSLIDSVFVTQFTDINLNTDQFYYYAIQAYDLTKPNPNSNLSSVLEVYSHFPGEVETVTTTSSKTLTVKFTEKMSNTIENLQAFKLNNASFSEPVIPNSISPANQFSYLLTFRDDIPIGENQLIISNLRDLYHSPIPPATVQFTMDSTIVSPEFFVSSFKIVDAYTVRLDFNLGVDEPLALNTNNYSFDPENKVTSVAVGSDKKSITLNLKGQKPVGSIGREYVLRLSNINSSEETGSIPINEGAGSYIVLTSFTNDLSEVYVYPNPVDASIYESITFANLPRYAKITIWSISGTKINEIEESDGNGGITYDLKDFSGSIISSGVYFYRIVMLDESNEEKEEKLGKFAVIR